MKIRRARAGAVLALACVASGCGRKPWSLTAEPERIRLGERAILRWSAEDARSCVLLPGVGPVLPLAGSAVVEPHDTTRYTLRCDETDDEVSVVVEGVAAAQIEFFAAWPRSILTGEPSTLSWSVLAVDACAIAPDVGEKLSPVGAAMVAPSRSTSYALECEGPSGRVSANAIVSVRSDPPRILRFGAFPALIGPGESAALAWATLDTRACAIEGLGPVPALSGSLSVAPAESTGYRLLCTGAGPQAAAMTATVTVCAAIRRFEVRPAVVFAGERATLAWASVNATQCAIDHGAGVALPPSGSIEVEPRQTTTYKMNCFGPAVATAYTTVRVLER